METPVQPVVINGGISTFRIIGIVLAFIIFASLISFSKNLIGIDFSEYYNYLYRNVFPEPSVHKNEDEVRSGPETVAPTQAVAPDSNASSSNQFWCLVGEDMAGRWCVQVLSSGMCPSDRSYGTKNECERFKTVTA